VSDVDRPHDALRNNTNQNQSKILNRCRAHCQCHLREVLRLRMQRKGSWEAGGHLLWRLYARQLVRYHTLVDVKTDISR
jgi:hypothetical protein